MSIVRGGGDNDVEEEEEEDVSKVNILASKVIKLSVESRILRDL